MHFEIRLADEARHGPPRVGTIIWANRAALGAGGHIGTDSGIHKRDEAARVMYWTADPIPSNESGPHRAKTMINISPTRSSSPAAQRMRRYRKHRKQGLRSVRILLDEMDVDALIVMTLLKEDQRQDVKALQKALLGLLYRAEENLA
jgi:hypothetical protein